jgi:hypothetical protein
MRSLLFAVSFVAASLGCPGASPPVQTVTDVAADACSMVEALTNDGAVRILCATASEIALIAGLVTALRDGGPPPLEPCTPLASTTVCATANELAKGIDAVNARRAATFVRDGGAS